jgi:hypothetical protein
VVPLKHKYNCNEYQEINYLKKEAANFCWCVQFVGFRIYNRIPNNRRICKL